MMFVSIPFYLMSSLLYYDYTNTIFLQICGISHTRGEEFSNCWPQLFESEDDKYSDEWYMERLLFGGFDEVYNNIDVIYLKVRDDSMSETSFWNIAKGGLSHLSYIFLNP